eukprot:767383-Hanusia_phi.AAC.2
MSLEIFVHACLSLSSIHSLTLPSSSPWRFMYYPWVPLTPLFLVYPLISEGGGSERPARSISQSHVVNIRHPTLPYHPPPHLTRQAAHLGPPPHLGRNQSTATTPTGDPLGLTACSEDPSPIT